MSWLMICMEFGTILKYYKVTQILTKYSPEFKFILMEVSQQQKLIWVLVHMVDPINLLTTLAIKLESATSQIVVNMVLVQDQILLWHYLRFSRYWRMILVLILFMMSKVCLSTCTMDNIGFHMMMKRHFN